MWNLLACRFDGGETSLPVSSSVVCARMLEWKLLRPSTMQVARPHPLLLHLRPLLLQLFGEIDGGR